MQGFLLKIFFLGALLFLNLEVSTLAQNIDDIDSLEQLLEYNKVQQQPDSIVNSLLVQSFNYYENNEWGKAVNIAKQGISLYKTSNFTYCKLWHEELGFLYLKHDIYQLALNTYYDGFSLGTNQQ